MTAGWVSIAANNWGRISVTGNELENGMNRVMVSVFEISRQRILALEGIRLCRIGKNTMM
jgi:hypothetical protein